MDGATCLKSLLLAIRHYKNSKSALNAAQLQRQIKDVSGPKCLKLLSSEQILPSECLSGLLDVAGDPSTDYSLTESIVSLLAQLASDDESRENLHGRYNLTSTLTAIIHCNRTAPEDPLVLQCLQVLQRLTYNMRTSHSVSYLDELITFLMVNIQSNNDDITKLCLGLLASLCRHNLSVQTHIKSQSNLKAFYNALIGFLSHNSLTVVIFALSILYSLSSNEEAAQKIFGPKNIHRTFQMIFNVTVNGDGSLARNYAVDLLVDLLKNSKMADFLTKYEQLPRSLSEVLGLLQGKDPDAAAKVLELLVSLCSVPALRRLICEIVFCPARPSLQLGARKAVHQGKGAGPCMALLRWATGPLDKPEQCYLQSLMLLTELFEEVIDSSQSHSVESFADLLLSTLLNLLKVPEPPLAGHQLKRHCERVGRAVDLLLVLCRDDVLRNLQAQHISSDLCASQVEFLLSSSQGDPASGFVSNSNLSSQVCSVVVLKILELMSQLKQQVTDMETCFYRTLQEQRIAVPLSLALTSVYREHVQTALRILTEAVTLPDFPFIVLGESIAANNAYCQREGELGGRSAVDRGDLSTILPLSTPASANPARSSLQNIDNLIETLQSGVQLQEQIKDVHVSEIIDVYEQKISALVSEESRLQDLLEAKALALSQADRLIAQSRCQRAQAEAEARKLASLLKEAERRKEELQTELSEQRMEMERLRADSRQISEHNGRLLALSEAHQALKGSHTELCNRLNERERMLEELQAAHISLTQKTERQIEALKTQVQEKDRNISDLQTELDRQGQRASDMEITISAMKKELKTIEQARKDASIKASSLELQKSQLEAKLQKKEEELSKHTQMIAMIHSLSSGKLKGDVTANLSL
ncbi:protein CIP2A [Chanos chanos]|uniref:Protein CIP2A n=1 Tax=Chanos chanos TaxID=29144 RepID=A0A6J2V299_CHACN|nr:protein CIP2A [Chanos chanos]